MKQPHKGNNMSKFNKDGLEFKNLVSVDRDPNQDPTYTHKYPARLPNGQVDERWSTKVRPLKPLTHYLQGMSLRRFKDYIVDFNPVTDKYEYWFVDPKVQLMFALACGHLLQGFQAPGQTFDVECPHCQQTFPRQDIKWV